MPDELDRQLLRVFGESHRPLEDEEFVARVAARLESRADRRRDTLRSAASTAVAGLTGGLRCALSVALRAPNAVPLTLAALALSVWAALA